MEKGYSGRDIRYWLISHHYRKPVRFSWKKLDTAKNTVSKLDQFVMKLHRCPQGRTNPDMDQMVYNLRHQFTEALDDDLNMALGLAALFQFNREINRIMDRDGLDPEDKNKILEILDIINTVLGVMDLEPGKPDQDIENLIRERDEAREKKDWTKADRIRDQLKGIGVEILDTKEGTVWRRR
jgi:cysteinyl-tRNA synthetase